MDALPKYKDEKVPFMVYDTLGWIPMKTGGHVRLSTRLLPLTYPFARLAWQQKLGKEFKKEALVVPKARRKEVIYGVIDMVSVFAQLWGISFEFSERISHKSCFEDDV